jgi:peptidoglycan/LPS O-acetylase OafA/YrhL
MNLIASPINGMVNHLTQNFLFAPTFAILMFCACRYDTTVSRFLASKSIVLLGEMSYSIYLVHIWMLRLFNHPPHPLTIFWGIDVAARIIASIGLSLAMAYGTYRLIEVPCRRWLRSSLRVRTEIQRAALQAA